MIYMSILITEETGAVQLLFKELKGIARQNGWPYVRWITATDNHRARAVL